VRRSEGYGGFKGHVSKDNDKGEKEVKTDGRRDGQSYNLTLKMSKQSGRWKGCRVPASTVN
jgi:hypothetical protein